MTLCHRLIVIGTLAIASALNAQPKPATVPASYASAGEAATGEVISDNGDQLRLNVTPCKSAQTVVIFHKPYATSQPSTIQCNGATKTMVQVVQQ